MVRRVVRAAVVVGVAAGTPGAARAAPVVILDTYSGPFSYSDRGAGEGAGALVNVANQDTPLNYIAVRNDLTAGGSLKFVVFSHPGHQPLFVSPPKFFADDGASWKLSDEFDVALEAGQSYDIGAIADVGARWFYDVSPAVMGNLSSEVANANFLGYDAPVCEPHGAADADVRLYLEGGLCGNGVVNGGEACDDGDADNSDACLSTCELAKCGDAFVRAGVEACDDGDDDDTDACLTSCVAAKCGDGFVHAGVEGCDDGNEIDVDECSNACVPASCGDGMVEGLEACDDGNPIDDDGCTNACTLPICGDGIVQAFEACDDGDQVDDDECSNACTIPAPGTSGGDDSTSSGEVGETGGLETGGSSGGETGSSGAGEVGSSGGGASEAGETGQAPTGSGPGETGGPSTSGDGEEGGDGPGGDPSGLPVTTMYTTGDLHDDGGCACATGPRGSVGLVWLLGLGFVRRRATAGARRS